VIDKSRLGLETKAIAPGEAKGPGAVRCVPCGTVEYHCHRDALPQTCPTCGRPLEVLKPEPR
jgi:rubrerythrin